MSAQHGVKHGVLVKLVLILAQNGKSLVFAERYTTRRGLHFAAQKLEKGRFTCAVCADDTVAVAGGEFDIDILKELAPAEGQSKVVCLQHSRRMPPVV